VCWSGTNFTSPSSTSHWNVTSPWQSWTIVHLTLSNTHSLTHSLTHSFMNDINIWRFITWFNTIIYYYISNIVFILLSSTKQNIHIKLSNQIALGRYQNVECRCFDIYYESMPGNKWFICLTCSYCHTK
jgi:hypothetical protein